MHVYQRLCYHSIIAATVEAQLPCARARSIVACRDVYALCVSMYVGCTASDIGGRVSIADNTSAKTYMHTVGTQVGRERLNMDVN